MGVPSTLNREELDAVISEDMAIFLCQVRLMTFAHDDNQRNLAELADRLGVPFESLRTYAWNRICQRENESFPRQSSGFRIELDDIPDSVPHEVWEDYMDEWDDANLF